MFSEIATPSPVRRLEVDVAGTALWVKDDSRIHPVYGGNKCRKLAHLLRDAESRGKTRVITFGAAGSHHVLATGLLGRMQGFQVQAFVVSQPWSAHAEQVLRSSVAAGVDLVPIRKNLRAVMRHARRLDWTSYIIPPGGSNLCGSVGYFEAAIELAQQIQWGELPEPDYIVVALGSGGTAAGLLAGLEFAGLKSRVVGVAVLGARGCGLYARQLSNAILRSVGSASSVSPDRLIVNKSVLGEGYGHESEPGKAARSKANSLDLPLDPTYTAKAFAGALSLAKGKQTGAVGNAWESNLPLRPSTVLYWHTLSVLPLANRDSATVSTLSRELQDLLRHCPKTDSSN